MATSCCNYFHLFLLFILYLSKSDSLENSPPDFPTLEDSKQWSLKLETEISLMFDSVTPYTAAQTQYNASYKDRNLVTFEQVDGNKMVQDIAKSMDKLLRKKMDALMLAVQFAEEKAVQHKWNTKFKIGEVEYINAKHLKREDDRLLYSEQFQQAIIYNVSSVHIPVEIYEGDLGILNGLRWTSNLDEIFMKNREADPDLLWQYFGSQTGFFRSLPEYFLFNNIGVQAPDELLVQFQGSRWQCHGTVDLYDVRRRAWYTQGSSSPKDMLVLIDTSGSVHGQALQLIKVAVKSLLDTLGENDFVNIVSFGADVKYVSCFTTFVQANYRNKKVLADGVNALTAEGVANFKKGLRFAFEQFKKYNDTLNQGANCNKAIMVLTDGGTETAKEVFEEYNWPNKTVRVFTYTVGPTADPSSSVRWMACANRGYFSPIPAMGAIRSRVQEYLKYFSPTTAPFDPLHHWVLRYDRGGLGMMTTVTLPVYNKTQGPSNQTILGVMGSDIRVSDMLKIVYEKRASFSPNGYAFSINHNGYVIFHPSLKGQFGWLKDPPNVDFLDVEVDDHNKEELRQRMIDGEENDQFIEGFVRAPDERHIHMARRTYYFTNIKASNFSIAVVLPPYAKLTPIFRDALKDYSILNSSKCAMIIPDWNYYENYGNANKTGTTRDLVEAANAGAVLDTDLMKSLFFDAKVTSHFDEFYQVSQTNDLMSRKYWEEVTLSFIGTHSGLTRIFPKSAEGEFQQGRDPWLANYYRRALDHSELLLMAPFPTAPRSYNESENVDVTMVRGITLNLPLPGRSKRRTQIKPAVVGVQFHHQLLHEMLTSIKQCNHSSLYSCYLLDDGGFIIGTSQEDQFLDVGRFLGTIDPPLMRTLVDEDVYHSILHWDYQGSCADVEKNTSSAGTIAFRIPKFPAVYELLTLNWWSSQLTWAYLNFNIYNWVFSPSDAYAEDDVSDLDCLETTGPTNHSCIKKSRQYYFNPYFQYNDSEVMCDNCTRRYQAVRLHQTSQKTNLLFVIVENGCVDCEEEPPEQEAVESDGPSLCTMQPRYRRRPAECYPQDESENSEECGSIVSEPSALLILLTSFLALVAVNSLTRIHIDS